MLERLFDLPSFTEKKYAKPDALSAKYAGQWVSFSHADFSRSSREIALALLAAGVRPGDRVINIGNNRPEWNFVDMGIMMCGAIHVPVYPVISDEDLEHILRETGARFAFAANNYTSGKIRKAAEKLGVELRLVVYDPLPGQQDLEHFRHEGKEAEQGSRLNEVAASIGTDDLATIIYTSGTTSVPKGVMLSHRNLIANFTAGARTLFLKPEYSAISYLPLCHVFERNLVYIYLYSGVSVYYAESVAGIMDNIREVRPHIMTTVPLLLEKVYQGILAKGSQLDPKKKKIFDGAMALAAHYPMDGKPGLLYRLRRVFYDLTVYKKWRAALGGRMMQIICGAAALQPQVLKAFWAAGIPVLEGYGLTETSPVISNNNLKEYRLGTVGKILDGVQVKIAPDGEIMTKGASVMLGYYFLPLPTFEVIDEDGWFHTGDMGEIVDVHFLRLTGRIKALFKTSSGLYVSPESIENQLKQSPFISQCMVVGANHSYLGALIIPDFEYILKFFESKGLPYLGDEILAEHTLVVREIEAVIDAYNKNQFETERIEKFRILASEWTIEKGELTPKMSLKREVIAEKHRRVVEGFFE